MVSDFLVRGDLPVRLLLAEIVFVLIALTGVAFIYWPGALILGGVLGVLAVERLSATSARPDNVVPLRRGEAA